MRKLHLGSIVSCFVLIGFYSPRASALEIYFNDFEDVPSVGRGYLDVMPEWSRDDTDRTPVGARRFLGQFGNDTVTLTLEELPEHNRIRISCDLFIILSWDGDETWWFGSLAPQVGLDRFRMSMDEDLVLLDTTFSNHSWPESNGSFQSFPFAFGAGTALPQSGATETNTLGYFYDFRSRGAGIQAMDSVYSLSFTQAHAEPNVCFSFNAFGLQGLGDESWGLDNVRVEVLQEGFSQVEIVAGMGGSVVTPGEGRMDLATGSQQPLSAVPDPNFSFVVWTGSAVLAGKVTDPFDSNATILVDDDFTLQALFKGPFAIPDPNLKALVAESLDVVEPNASDLLDLTCLGCAVKSKGRGIENLQGLEYASNLTELYLSKNVIDSIEPLAGLSRLKVLDLKGNRVKDTSPLANLKSFETLRLPGNRIRDLQALAGLDSLTHLELSDNLVTDLSPLHGLERLSSLGVDENRIYDLGPLADLDQLESLYLSNNHVADLSPLQNLTGLRDLGLGHNRLTDVNSLGLYSQLKQLNLSGNPIVVWDFLAELKQLQRLDLYGCELVDTAIFAGLSQLRKLHLGWNDIADIEPLSGLSLLESLDLSWNPLTDLSPIRNMIHLENLRIGPDVTDLTPISNLTNLRYLQLRDTQVKDLAPLAAMPSLDSIDARGSQIRDLKHLADRTDLLYLDVRDNPLNTKTHTTYLPQIEENNPGIDLRYDLPVWVSLRVDSTGGGEVIEPGEGTFRYIQNEKISLEAVPEDGYSRFVDWTGSARDSHNLVDLQYPVTELVMEDNYDLTANFEASDINHPGQGYSLGIIPFQSQAEFEARVTTNDYVRVDAVEFVTGQEPDPTGMMQMRAMTSRAVRAKAVFEQTGRERMQVRFKYLFTQDIPGMELIVYLSDVPELLDQDDADRAGHYREIARLSPPPPGFPGAVGSARFAEFERTVEPNGLDLSHSTYLELEVSVDVNAVNDVFAEPAFLHYTTQATDSGGAVWVDDMSILIVCSGYCMDLNFSGGVEEQDFMLVMAGTGRAVALGPEGRGSSHCLEGMFSEDGYVDNYDVLGFDWTLLDPFGLKSYCQMPLHPKAVSGYMMMGGGNGDSHELDSLPTSGLMILGKRGSLAGSKTNKLKDGIYSFQSSGLYNGWIAPDQERGAMRLVMGSADQIYVVNGTAGLLALDAHGETTPVIPPAPYPVSPLLSVDVQQVWIGVQDHEGKPVGRPIFDAVVTEESIYVVPVVVESLGGEVYLAAAQLQPADSGYEVTQIYDVRSLGHTGDRYNPKLDGLREIALDGEGNVYLLNVQQINESDRLIRIHRDGSVEQVVLGIPGTAESVPDPIGLTVDSDRGLIYIGSAQVQHDGIAEIEVFSTADLKHVDTLTVSGMSHVTNLTVQPEDGTLWGVGYTMDSLPGWPYPDAAGPAFYEPRLAGIPFGVSAGAAFALKGGAGDLSLPISVLWLSD